jgi:hypothetical protein
LIEESEISTLEGMPDEYRSDRIKHLEMIQAVIARLANEAALIKGWALTVSAAFFGLAAQQSFSARIAVIALLPVAAFWGLNAYYLRQERKYRSLYNRVRLETAPVLFDMDAKNEEADSFRATVTSATLAPFYGVIFFVGVVLIIAGIIC